MTGIYIHIPFCIRKCPYCDFYSFKADESKKDSYLKAVLLCLGKWKEKISGTIDTVYFGGGTPSVFGSKRISQVLSYIKSNYDLTDDAEITVECNPSSVSAEFFSEIKAAGANRISMGMQSAVDDERKALGRQADSEQVKRAVEGYRDGYLAAGGTGCDIHYLSEETDGGYRMQDEAYQFCLENDGEYMYYFSAAGASNKGMYRFSRESYNLAVGMDDNMGFFSSLITMSVVKHMDKVIIDVLGDLLENRDIPYHQKFTYSSGYEEMVFSEGMSADFFLDISDIRNRIIEIEQSYEESLQ